MEKICHEERWALLNSADNSAPTPENGGGAEAEEDADVDALSLCDLPLIHHSRKDNDEGSTTPLIRASTETPEDFDFCCLLKEPEMCAADEVFFQGRILPFRRLMSSGEGFLQYSGSCRSISRSESMDFHSSGGLISSRSSSISSHQSSSSGSSATDPKSPPLNPFHSRPISPSPRTRFSSTRQKMVWNDNRNHTKKPSAWNIFRLGLLTPPEIAFQDLKTRCPSSSNRKNFGSRNSTSSNSSSSSDKKIKIIPRRALLLGGCNSSCSIDAIDTVPSKVVTIKRSASDSEMEARVEEESLLAMKSPKKRLSHRRTFEWLKQLSLDEA
ncbi:UNVERIFIED_CONTAM: hypothetical protein Sradi_0949800 [Sesamum radiatum]|uniref:Uncharacterized protein n=1 Tax=Sesamum radiatum TaxID=300843 RepID=A0AAW2V348_SESRA